MRIHKILVSDSLHPDAIAWLDSQPGVEVNVEAKIAREELLQIIGGFDALIVRGRTKVGPEEIRHGQRLRVIGRAGTGLDNIDAQAAEKANVLVLNAPGANANAVAELTMGLILALARHLPEAFTVREKLPGYGWELEGKRLGIVGLGRIGSRVARLASAFGMQLIAHEPDPKAGPTDLAIQRVDFRALIQESEAVTLHVPLTNTTRHLLDGKALRQMRTGSVLVNTARAEIVDEAALLQALDEGRVSGYAADVFNDQRLIDHPRVVLTPHIGAQTEEAQRRAGLEIAESVVSALRGRPG